MDTRIHQVNRTIKNYDRTLYAKREGEMVSIYRDSTRFLPYSFDGSTLLYSVSVPNHVFSLTDSWQRNGQPVEWGLEPISNRLRAMDLWNRSDFAEDLIKEYEKDKESKKRDFMNSTESFLLDFRRQFARTFNDINTSTMAKTDSRRTQGE